METLLVILQLVLNVVVAVALWRLGSAASLFARDYDAECHAMTKAMEEQAVSIKLLAEYLKSKS